LRQGRKTPILTPSSGVIWGIPVQSFWETIMADGGGGASGVLGVLVGAMLVVFIGAAVLMATGNFGKKGPSFTIQMPK